MRESTRIDGPPIERTLIDVAETAAILRCRPSTVYALAARNRLPGLVRIGRLVRFHRATLLAWLESVANDGD
jgi:excisionase family DNA binding protein